MFTLCLLIVFSLFIMLYVFLLLPFLWWNKDVYINRSVWGKFLVAIIGSDHKDLNEHLLCLSFDTSTNQLWFNSSFNHTLSRHSNYALNPHSRHIITRLSRCPRNSSHQYVALSYSATLARREASVPTRCFPSNRRNVNKLLSSFIVAGADLSCCRLAFIAQHSPALSSTLTSPYPIATFWRDRPVVFIRTSQKDF